MPVFPQAAEDVFHVHDGVVDQFADGHGQTSERHGVDTEPGGVEYDEGDKQGQRYRGQGDRRGAEVEEKNKQDDRHHETPVAQGFFHVVHGPRDEIALPENIGVNFHALRQRRADDGQLGLDFSSQIDGVGAGLLLHGEDHAGFSIDTGIAALVQRGSLTHLGDLSEQDAGTVGEHFDHGRSQIIRALHTGQIADEALGVRVGKKAAGRIHVRFVDRGLHLVQSHPGGDQHGGIDKHLVLAHVAAHHGDLRHARNAHEPAAHIPVRQRAQLHGTDRGIFARQTDGHDLSHDRGHRTEERADVLRQPRGHFGYLFPDNLPRAVDIRVPSELDEDERKADARHGPNALDAGCAVDCRFQWHGDERLHFVGSQAAGLGKNRDGRAVQVGENIDRNAGEDITAVGRKERGNDNHQEAIADGKSDEPVEHGVSGRGRARRWRPQCQRLSCIEADSGRW